jgi:hypothetical protein
MRSSTSWPQVPTSERGACVNYHLLSEGGSWTPDLGVYFYVPIRLVAHLTLWQVPETKYSNSLIHSGSRVQRFNNHALKDQINISPILLEIFQQITFNYVFLQNPVSLISSIQATCPVHHNV